jgi:tetratricopeptide (TPR) repeat protein
LQQLIQFDHREGSAPDRLDDAISESGVEAFLLGHGEDAARLLDDARRENPLDSVPPENRPYASLVAAYVVAGRVDRAQALMAEFQRVVSSEIRTQGGEFPLAQAYLALARKDGATALSNARLAQDRFACLLCVTFEQARAFELLQQPDSAIIAYERIVNLPSMDNEERHLTYPAALRRLGELYDNKGDRKKALEYDGRLVDLWKDADPELQGVIRDVRRRMAELAGEPPRR